MHKDEAARIIARHRGEAISVATMQAAAPWHESGAAKHLHIDASGCMGSASSLGLGLALGRPERKVVVLDGDGSLMMQLGSLASIAGLAPANFYHFVFANGVYESSGNQAIPGGGRFDFAAVARGAGYRRAFDFADGAALDAAMPQVLAEPGPVMIVLRIAVDGAEPRWPGVAMAKQVEELRAELASGRA